MNYYQKNKNSSIKGHTVNYMKSQLWIELSKIRSLVSQEILIIDPGTELWKPLYSADQFTLNQVMMFLEITDCLLGRVCACTLTGVAKYLKDLDEDYILSYWSEQIDWILTELNQSYNQSGIESFLGSFRTDRSGRGR